ncbi:DUF3078 domain-containing protein [bacterium]|nr:DUF3078 domain-containing protein [bacterium]MBU1674232.1 DUF3078 domain-containing protein [bacterium]
MRRKAIVCVAVLAAAAAANAGAWEKTADLGLLFSQSSYSDEWAGSELGTMTWTFNADMVAARNMSASTNWKNTLKLKYGQTHQEKEADGGKAWARPLKSTDRVFLESLMRFGVEHPITPYAAFTVESQFHDGGNNLLAPALLTESSGVGRTLVKDERTELLTRVGFAARQRMAHGVKTVNDAGVEWVSDLSHTFSENLKAVSKLRVFQAVTSSASDDLAGLPGQDDWKGVDMAWETTFSAAVSKYIQATLFFEVLYDEEIVSKARYRELFGFGVTYKLF